MHTINNPEFSFDILLDEEVLSFGNDKIDALGNEKLISVANDYEGGTWRFQKFMDFIWDNVQETALTMRERLAYIGQPMSIIRCAANRLRLSSDDGKGSEIAEIFLYGMMRRYYGALPIVPKIFHKQNRNDNAKGADSVHILVLEDGRFEIWLGEAKFYKRINNSNIENIISSVEHSLSLDAIAKEKSIVLGLHDLEDCLQSKYNRESQTIYSNICHLLQREKSIDELMKVLHVPILLIDECDITRTSNRYDEKYKNDLKEYHRKRAMKYFARQIARLKNTVVLYSEIKFHLILFPVPDKAEIVNKYIEDIEHLRR